MNSPVDDPKKGWLSWYNGTLEETRNDLPFSKKLHAIFRRSRYVLCTCGFAFNNYFEHLCSKKDFNVYYCFCVCVEFDAFFFFFLSQAGLLKSRAVGCCLPLSPPIVSVFDAFIFDLYQYVLGGGLG